MKVKSLFTILLVVMLLVCSCSSNDTEPEKDPDDGIVIKTEHCSINDAMLEYLFYSNYYDNYSGEADYYGLSLDLTFSEQNYSEGVSWQEHLSREALENAKKYVLLKEAGIAQGFIYEADIDSKISEYAENAAALGITTEDYYKDYFGENITEEVIRDVLDIQLYAVEYEKSLKDEHIAALTEADYTEYYEEHKADIEIVDVLTYSIPINYYGVINSEARDSLLSCKTPEEFKSWIANDLTEKNEKSETPKTAEELAAKIAEKTEVSRSYYTPGGDFSEWAFAEETELYDTHYAEKNTGMYDIYMLVKKPYAWEKYNHNVGQIYLNSKNYATIDEAAKKAEDIISEFNENGGTKEAFEELSKKYSDNKICFLNNVADDFFGDEQSRLWLNDQTRTQGDITALPTRNGYNVIYYVDQGVQRWMADAADYMAQTYLNTYITDFEKENADQMTLKEDAVNKLPDSLPQSTLIFY